MRRLYACKEGDEMMTMLMKVTNVIAFSVIKTVGGLGGR